MLKGFPLASCENGNLVKTLLVFQGNDGDICYTMNNSFALRRQEYVRSDWRVERYSQ